ncbi:sua5 family protein [Leptolyngbya sp. Heron Island J]|uniref:L-threonylcarbamoyladenylate synthase n=1 Tax=Leptolyngbya sp. Heron Island J TaxID=1385935 RepID=UPI0003B9A884|nr:L-threonylcarbamoyladenylate synthase [Leptolyngbya sp. Heron Island J]ESA37538.1 sua5 family protein [Leptolyngbya sp. Heron Island J]
MATIYTLHPESPQAFKIEKIRKQLQKGAVMLYATDTVYAIGCDLQSKSAIQRVRQLKKLSNDKPLTFLCLSLSNIAQYAYVSDPAYRTMRHLIPGPYTFILPATKLVPKLVMNPKRKTTGIRVPDHAVCQALLQNLGNPIISTSAHVGDMDETYLSRYELFDALDKQVDIIIDSEADPSYLASTILDMTADEPIVRRKGLGFDVVEQLATISVG